MAAARPMPAATGAKAAPAFARPPSVRDDRGRPRRVGVEMEFQGIGARAAASALAQAFGGTLREEDPHAFHIADTALGRLSVELDMRYAHPQRTDATPRVRLGAAGAAWLGTLLGRVVPRELVTAPLDLDALDRVDRAVAVLRGAGARGRGATLFGSLGLHFNVDPVSLEPRAITAVLKAFLLLNRSLRRGIAERGPAHLPPMAYLPAPYPDSYVRRVVAPDYRPELPALIDDYLDANPSRDRDLDMLPMFLHLDPERVRARLPYEKIGSRAVFHYRLPRAHVSDPDWSIAEAWNGWVAVERLAADAGRLEALGRARATR